jgi:hypothetical protein
MTRPRPAPGGGRRLGVAPERLGRWLDGVAERHGALADVVTDDDGTVRLTCADTTTVVLRAPFGWTPEQPVLAAFIAAARAERTAAVLLVRRGRWAVGVFAGERLVVSKVDARQVQGRTAAGGWSQQRFARRRGHQTDAVVTSAADTAARVLLPHLADVVALFTGGDRGLVDDVLADRRLAGLTALRRGPHLDVGEPTKAVLLETPAQLRAVEATIVEPADR